MVKNWKISHLPHPDQFGNIYEFVRLSLNNLVKTPLSIQNSVDLLALLATPKDLERHLRDLEINITIPENFMEMQ